MVSISCLACGESIELPPHIDTEDYDGEVPCQECGALLYIKLVKSKLRKYKVVDKNFGFKGSEFVSMWREIREAYRKPNDSF